MAEERTRILTQINDKNNKIMSIYEHSMGFEILLADCYPIMKRYILLLCNFELLLPSNFGKSVQNLRIGSICHVFPVISYEVLYVGYSKVGCLEADRFELDRCYSLAITKSASEG